ncbi:CRISPR-associated protein CasA/Cse1 (plasmid) [Variovorax sp. PBL-E5]|nr:CRISPR-associated protein CasA/Cse1 [Variovorax sp. SRS16]VTU43405.1 CRISPR-associated protein CasA/Cse1 [Variovorax sp. PBL-E5]
MCPHCAPAALFGNQAHAGQGGSGYKVALRGGSALAALIEAPTLWETICLNLLDRDTYTDRYCLEGGAEEDFPWTTGLKVFSKEAIGPRELGAHAALWWMPRALRLHESANADGTSCSTCGEVHPTHIRTASRDKTAARPPEGLRHPHTAWCMLKNEKEIDGVKTKVDVEAAVMVPSEGYMLGDWLALTLGAQTPTRRILAGLPAMAHLSRAEAARATLRVFGPRYATATFLTWFDEAGPLLAAADAEHLRQLRAEAEKLVAEAQRVLVIVRTAARKNLGSKKRPLAVPLSSSPGQLESELAGRARSLISRALAKVDGAGGSLTQDDYEQFCSQLRKAAVSLFNRALVIDFANETLSHKLVLLSAKTYSLIYPKAKPASNQDAIAA